MAEIKMSEIGHKWYTLWWDQNGPKAKYQCGCNPNLSALFKQLGSKSEQLIYVGNTPVVVAQNAFYTLMAYINNGNAIVLQYLINNYHLVENDQQRLLINDLLAMAYDSKDKTISANIIYCLKESMKKGDATVKENSVRMSVGLDLRDVLLEHFLFESKVSGTSNYYADLIVYIMGLWAPLDLNASPQYCDAFKAFWAKGGLCQEAILTTLFNNEGKIKTPALDASKVDSPAAASMLVAYLGEYGTAQELRTTIGVLCAKNNIEINKAVLVTLNSLNYDLNEFMAYVLLPNTPAEVVAATVDVVVKGKMPLTVTGRYSLLAYLLNRKEEMVPQGTTKKNAQNGEVEIFSLMPATQQLIAYAFPNGVDLKELKNIAGLGQLALLEMMTEGEVKLTEALLRNIGQIEVDPMIQPRYIALLEKIMDGLVLDSPLKTVFAESMKVFLKKYWDRCGAAAFIGREERLRPAGQLAELSGPEKKCYPGRYRYPIRQ
jgi:hypothetical protein